MIENVRSVMDRVAAIQSTIGATQSAPVAPAAGSSPDAIRQMFDRAMAQAASGTIGGATSQLFNTGLTPTAGRIRSGAPRGFEGHSNGQIPESRLVPIRGSNERLWAPAASAFEHMRSDAARAGVRLPVVDGYRTHEDQVRLADELGLYKNGGRAAVPGTSQHGWGRALDLELDDQGLAWMRANAWKYGFVETVPREPWHWEFHPSS